MSSEKPRKPAANPLYLLLREERSQEFNQKRKEGAACELIGCDMRGLDLREFDLKEVDLSDCFLRQADLRGQDLRSCRLQGASLHAAHISGVYFPSELAAAEIQMSVQLGTRMRYR